MKVRARDPHDKRPYLTDVRIWAASARRQARCRRTAIIGKWL